MRLKQRYGVVIPVLSACTGCGGLWVAGCGVALAFTLSRNAAKPKLAANQQQQAFRFVCYFIFIIFSAAFMAMNFLQFLL